MFGVLRSFLTVDILLLSLLYLAYFLCYVFCVCTLILVCLPVSLTLSQQFASGESWHIPPYPAATAGSVLL